MISHSIRVLLLAICLPVVMLRAAPASTNAFEFQREDGLCRLEANEARLNDILDEISVVTGIPIVVDPANMSTVTVSLAGYEMEALLNAISSGANITYIQEPGTDKYRIEKIIMTSSVDPEEKQRQLRQALVAQEELARKMRTRSRKSVTYSGIGARVLMAKDKQGVWLRPMSNDAPAARAEIETGDLLLAVDGRAISDFEDLKEIVRAIRGPVNTVVNLKIRCPDGTEVVKHVTRTMYKYKPPQNNR